MKKIIAITLISILALTLLSGCGKEASASWQDEINANAEANKYTLLFIDDGSSSDTKNIKNSMVELSGKLSDQFVFVDVDYAKEKDNVLKYLSASGISEFPLALTIAPSGLISGGFTKECTEDELKATIVSGKKEEIFLSMQNGLVSLICVHNGETEKLTEVRESLESVEANYKGVVALHYLDTTNDADTEFISMLPETTGDITVMITLPSGSIGAVLTDDEITLTNLLAAFQSSCSSGSCGTGGCG